MADIELFPDDISGLWAQDHEDVLTPATTAPAADVPEPVVPQAQAPTENGNGSTNGHGNGTRRSMVEQETREDVARLARAIADSHVDVVRPADLQAARAQMEGAFTQQLAVALYELMAATNARFATAEDHINQRVDHAVEVHTCRLAGTLEANHRAASEMAQVIWSEIDSLRQRLAGPIDGFAEFQRDLRHEVGRLGDLVTAHSREWAKRTDVEAGQRDLHDQQTVRAADGLGDISRVLARMKDDLATLREEVAELRAAVEDRSPKPRKAGRWGRGS